ncbi:MAG: alpha/beta fold hydrolase [Bdellovibrionia bacterium]
MKWALVVISIVFCQFARAEINIGAGEDPSTWEQYSQNKSSVEIEPERETAITRDGLTLVLKHFPRPGAIPILLIHGLAENDRVWDARMKRFSFARFLHSEGFDVWLGNMRGAGTAGFRSDSPDGPHAWSTDDYAIYDLPVLVDRVKEITGQPIWLIGHSLAAWVIEGYLGGLTFDSEHVPMPIRKLVKSRAESIRGVVTIAGIYNLWWQKSVHYHGDDPLRSEEDFYHSNYELELVAKTRALYYLVPQIRNLPVGWLKFMLGLKIDEVPFIGTQLQRVYENFVDSLTAAPIFNMFYYPPNSEANLVRMYSVDGLEDLSTHILEQIGNAVTERATSSYYHITPPAHRFLYASVRKVPKLPILFVGGGRDRLANADMIYQDGYMKSEAPDKQFLGVPLFGHLDILQGIHAPHEVMAPIAKWLHER